MIRKRVQIKNQLWDVLVRDNLAFKGGLRTSVSNDVFDFIKDRTRAEGIRCLSYGRLFSQLHKIE